MSEFDGVSVARRFQQYKDIVQPARGDHDLNPGFDAPQPLVPAAVLVPLVDRPDNMTILLTRRCEHLATHPGQISFPGGHVEPGDGTSEKTALRETEEETGITPRHVTIIGRLECYVTGTGFAITPVVGIVEPGFVIDPDPTEVDEVFEVPLSFFLDPANHQRHSRTYQGRIRHYYAMPYGEYFIWGATAGMIHNLYELLVDP